MVCEAAKKKNLQWWLGEIRDWSPVTEFWLNTPKKLRAEEQKLSKAAKKGQLQIITNSDVFLYLYE